MLCKQVIMYVTITILMIVKLLCTFLIRGIYICILPMMEHTNDDHPSITCWAAEEVGHIHVRNLLYGDFHTFLYMLAELNVIYSGVITLVMTISVKILRVTQGYPFRAAYTCIVLRDVHANT